MLYNALIYNDYLKQVSSLRFHATRDEFFSTQADFCSFLACNKLTLTLLKIKLGILDV